MKKEKSHEWETVWSPMIWGIAIAICLLAWGYISLMATKHKAHRATLPKIEEFRSVQVLTIQGDTVTIRGGATCHIYKELK